MPRPFLSAAWSEDDLVANRRGQLSRRQLVSIGRRTALILVGLLAAMVAVTATLVVEYHAVAPHETVVDLESVALVVDGFSIYWIVRSLRRVFDLLARRVLVVHGRCDFTRTQEGDLGHVIAGHTVKPMQPIDNLYVKEVVGYLLPRTKLLIAIELAKPLDPA